MDSIEYNAYHSGAGIMVANLSNLSSSLAANATAATATATTRKQLTHEETHHDLGEVTALQVCYMLALTIFLVIGVYVIVALVTFEVRQRRRWFYQTDASGQSVVVAAPHHHSFASKRNVREWLTAEDSDTLAKKMRLCSIASPVCAVLLYTVQLGFELLHAFTEDIHYCQLKSDLVFLLLTWSTSFISLLLWLRQRSMYAHHCRKQFTNRFRSFLNYTSFLLILVDFLLVPLIFSVSKRLINLDGSCHTAADLHIHHIFITVIIIISFILHASLLYLFIAPLRHHKRTQEHHQQSGSTSLASDGTAGAPGLPRSRASRHLKSIIHHASVVSVWDLILDVAIFFTNLYFADKLEWAQALIDDFILMMGVVVAIFTFINWRQRLCPFCTKMRQNPFHSVRGSDTCGGKEASGRRWRRKMPPRSSSLSAAAAVVAANNGMKKPQVRHSVDVVAAAAAGGLKNETVIKNAISATHNYCKEV